MVSGPDGDDDELVEIELEELPGEAEDEAPLPPRAPPSGPPVIPTLPTLPSASSPSGPSRAPRPDEAPAAPPATPAPPVEGEVELGDLVEVRQPIVEAAETDARADRELFESEAAAADEAPRRAALHLEAARLLEAEGDRAGALAAARAAFAADPSLTITLWTLRRLLTNGEHWQELADAYGTAADATPTPVPGDSRAARARADLL